MAEKRGDIAPLTDLQHRLIDRAFVLTIPGGRIVYCICSLEPEKGEQQIEALLARESGVRRKPALRKSPELRSS